MNVDLGSLLQWFPGLRQPLVVLLAVLAFLAFAAYTYLKHDDYDKLSKEIDSRETECGQRVWGTVLGAHHVLELDPDAFEPFQDPWPQEGGLQAAVTNELVAAALEIRKIKGRRTWLRWCFSVAQDVSYWVMVASVLLLVLCLFGKTFRWLWFADVAAALALVAVAVAIAILNPLRRRIVEGGRRG